MIDLFVRRRKSLVALIIGVVLLSGCEPLRKKFTRQKKVPETSAVMPVLEPITYPAKVETPESLLHQHYGLWKVWFQEAMTSIQEKHTDRRIRYNLAQLLVQVERLQGVFSGESLKILRGYQNRLKKVQTKMEQPEGVRNMDIIRAELIAIDKDFRSRFRPDLAAASLSK